MILKLVVIAAPLITLAPNVQNDLNRQRIMFVNAVNSPDIIFEIVLWGKKQGTREVESRPQDMFVGHVEVNYIWLMTVLPSYKSEERGIVDGIPVVAAERKVYPKRKLPRASAGSVYRIQN